MEMKCDFQDMELWREFKYKIIKHISKKYNGIIIIPMTLVIEDYFEEIIGKLEKDNIKVHHFILEDSKDTIKSRLDEREKKEEREQNWAEMQIDRCLKAFEDNIKGIKLLQKAKALMKFLWKFYRY